MIDLDTARQFVMTQYGLPTCSITPLRSDEQSGRFVGQIEAKTGQTWLLRAYRADGSLPAGLAAMPITTWLASQAALLRYLDQQHYPAPRIIPTIGGHWVAQADNWSSILITFTLGTAFESTAAQMGALAHALAHLHAIPLPSNPALRAVLPHAWWHPIGATTDRAQAWLTQVSVVPPHWQPFYTDCVALFEVAHTWSPAGPPTIIHADCWAGNALQRPDGTIGLIDWDCAGQGSALLDLGALLGECSAQSGEQAVVHTPSVRAVLDGYQSQRPIEHISGTDMLLAIRFGTAFRSALRFALAERTGWPAALQRGLVREADRFAVSSAIAETVLAHLAQ